MGMRLCTGNSDAMGRMRFGGVNGKKKRRKKKRGTKHDGSF
jgi:hypothetical protein